MTLAKNRFYQRFGQISGKIVFSVLLVLLMGVPIVQTWKMCALLAGVLALIYGDVILEKRRLLFGMGVIVFILVVKSFLPVAGIEEGHNIFLVVKDGEALQRGLPREVFKMWREAFEDQYPPDQHPEAPWRKSVPIELYAKSSDSLWRTTQYSRKVNAISFSNLSEFRGGFANDVRYNFFGDDPISFARNYQVQLPFFVMYEFSGQSVGCTLQWRGTVYWQKDAVSFEKITHANFSGKMIAAGDAGKRVYALNLPAGVSGGSMGERIQSLKAMRTRPLSEPEMHLELSPKLAVSRTAGNLLGLIGMLVLTVFMTKIRWKSYIAAISVTALSLIIICLFIHYSTGKFLGPEYPTHGGGDDGIVHESLGRSIAQAAMNGKFREAFEGNEPIYWFTPGMRYARAIEKIIFGDTNLGYTAFVSLLPWLVFLLIKQFAGFKWGMAGTIWFLFFPLGRFSFLQYIQNAKLGYAEAMGFGLFILGFYLLMRSQPRWGGQKDGFFAFIGGMCLAGSMFVRPNFAIAVALLGLFFLYASWRNRDYTLIGCVSAGLAFALIMPIHNLYCGHEFYLISKSGATVSVPLSPVTYFRAGQELLTGNWQGQHVNQAIKQIYGWLWSMPRLSHPYLKFVAELFMVVNLFTLALTVFIAFRPSLRREAVFVLAWTALAAHVPMLFIFYSGQFRYAMLAWDLSAILTIVIIAKGLCGKAIQTTEARRH